MYVLRNIQHYIYAEIANASHILQVTCLFSELKTSYVRNLSVPRKTSWLRPVSLMKLKCKYICLCNASNKIEREFLVSCRGWESPPADKHSELPRAGVSSSVPPWASSAEQQLLQCPEVLTQVCELERGSRGSREPHLKNWGDLLTGVGISVLV